MGSKGIAGIASRRACKAVREPPLEFQQAGRGVGLRRHEAFHIATLGPRGENGGSQIAAPDSLASVLDGALDFRELSS
jgi:hypothetical protein